MNLPDLHLLLQTSIVNQEPLINPYLHLPPKGTVADRVAIYTNGYRARLEEALSVDYSTLASLIGEDEFSQLCRNYINAFPSYSDTLDLLGQNLSRFLAQNVPYSKKEYLAEIASFEWAEAQSVIARDEKLLLASDLHSLPLDQWPEITFSLHPSCTFIIMHWNSLAIIESIRDKKTIPRKKRLKTPQTVIVWRRHLDVRYYKLSPIELTLLRAIESRLSFMEICECLSDMMPESDVAPFLVQELYAWINEQLLIWYAKK